MRNPYAPPNSNVALGSYDPVNWGKVVVYAASLLVAQVAVGFFEGLVVPYGARILAGTAASLLICAAIFAHLSARQPSRPFFHAWLALLLGEFMGWILVRVLAVPDLHGSYPLVVIEYLSLLVALGIGTVVGSHLRRSSNQPYSAQQAVAADRPKTGAG